MSPQDRTQSNQNLLFLEKFLELYQDVINHDGYSDVTIKISQANAKQKLVKLKCGCEYTYTIHPTSSITPNRYKVIDTIPQMYSGPERRSTQNRRQATQRRKNNEPRNFRLERRLQSERRTTIGRRKND